MSEFKYLPEVYILRGICSGYSEDRRSSRSMTIITNWNDMDDNSNLSSAYASMHNTLKDGHPN